MRFNDSYYKYFSDYIYFLQNIPPYYWKDYICKRLPESELNIFKKYFTPITREEFNEKILPGYKGDTKDPNEIHEYRLKPEIKKSWEKNKITEEIKIIIRIVRNHFKCSLGPFPSLALSSVYKECIDLIELGGVQFFNRRTQGKKSKEFTMMENKLPPHVVILPTKVGSDETKYLNIPKRLCNVFDIKDRDKYLLGIQRGIYSETLYFFPFKGERRKFKISYLDPDFIEDSNSAEDASVFGFSSGDIYIWHDPITVKQRSEGAFYFNNLPRYFYSISEADTILFDKSKDETLPTEPAFVIAHDMIGNLIYQRILYTDKKDHDGYPFPIILMSELPTKYKIDKNITLEELYSMKSIIDLYHDNEK